MKEACQGNASRAGWAIQAITGMGEARFFGHILRINLRPYTKSHSRSPTASTTYGGSLNRGRGLVGRREDRVDGNAVDYVIGRTDDYFVSGSDGVCQLHMPA